MVRGAAVTGECCLSLSSALCVFSEYFPDSQITFCTAIRRTRSRSQRAFERFALPCSQLHAVINMLFTGGSDGDADKQGLLFSVFTKSVV